MATFEKPQSTHGAPLDLLSVIGKSGVLSDRVFAEVKNKVLHGDFPVESNALAERLIREKLITDYQSKRFLAGKAHGLLVDRYVIVDRLGSGSMGRVYKAHHQMMDRYVALKIIAPELVRNEKVVARFQREMKLVGRLDHPNVIRAFDANEFNKILYIVMEFVQGISLGQRMRKGPIPPIEMVEYASQAAFGLAHAHTQGIVHRDIKPSNLLLTNEKQIKVLDLGLGVLVEADDPSSFATADGIAVGTVDYMSPEQACGREVDGRSDLFSLGCSMYHLMTGKLPFPGDSPIERMGKRISGKHVPLADVAPQIPPSLVKIIDQLLANKPQDRFQDANQAGEALQAIVRPRAKPQNSAVAPPKPNQEGEAAPRPEPIKEQVFVKVYPVYPGWFSPLASRVEKSPKAMLASFVAAAISLFATGILLGKFVF